MHGFSSVELRMNHNAKLTVGAESYTYLAVEILKVACILREKEKRRVKCSVAC